MVRDMQERGIIRPSSSPWASPIVSVKKSNGSYRFCVDYRKLNAVTRKDVFPLPRIEDLIDKLGGSCVFTCLDAASGYWQVRMSTGSRAKTAFITQSGLYSFRTLQRSCHVSASHADGSSWTRGFHGHIHRRHRGFLAIVPGLYCSSGGSIQAHSRIESIAEAYEMSVFLYRSRLSGPQDFKSGN